MNSTLEKIDASTITDEKLVETIINTGEIELFGELYDRYSDKVFRKVIGMLRNKEESRDVTHDILIKIMLNLSKYNHKAKFGTWVYMVTYNGCIDYIRKKRLNTISYDVADNSSFEPVAEDEQEDKLSIDIEILEELLELIPVEDKTILLMFYQDKMSIKELASYFDIGESAVKMRLMRAKKKIKNIHQEKYSANVTE